jgi:hypothetical protein
VGRIVMLVGLGGSGLSNREHSEHFMPCRVPGFAGVCLKVAFPLPNRCQ